MTSWAELCFVLCQGNKEWQKGSQLLNCQQLKPADCLNGVGSNTSPCEGPDAVQPVLEVCCVGHNSIIDGSTFGNTPAA
jgi:hypothetical protein